MLCLCSVCAWLQYNEAGQIMVPAKPSSGRDTHWKVREAEGEGGVMGWSGALEGGRHGRGA